jgi:hypothetical protein
LSGSSSLTTTSTVAGSVPLVLSSASSLLMKSAGRINPPRTSPSFTFCSTSARVETSTQSIFAQSWLRASSWLKPPLPRLSPAPAGIWLRKAIRGFSGLREIASPIRTARTIG